MSNVNVKETHEQKEIYEKVLLGRLRQGSVVQNFFNTKYNSEGASAGFIKIPYKTGGSTVQDYNAHQGLDFTISQGTKYKVIDEFLDKGINEILDYTDVKKVPYDLQLNTLDTAALDLLEEVEKDGFAALVKEGTEVDVSGEETLYEKLLELNKILTEKNVPTFGRKLAISPSIEKAIMTDPNFVKKGDTSQDLMKQGPVAIGTIAGFEVFVTNHIKEAHGVDIIATHDIASTRIEEIIKSPELINLRGGRFIGSVAIQARVRTAYAVLRPEIVLVVKEEE